MRDIKLGTTFYHFFSTRRFDTGVPITLASGALSVFEEQDATPITSGVSVDLDRNSVAGLHQATVVATTGNGYVAGRTYCIYISTGTVNSVSAVGEIVGQFTVEGQLSSSTIDELGVGVPPANPTEREAIMLPYMALRNKCDTSTSGTDTFEIHNDADVRIAQKLLTDSGGDYSEAKMITGA